MSVQTMFRISRTEAIPDQLSWHVNQFERVGQRLENQLPQRDRDRPNGWRVGRENDL